MNQKFDIVSFSTFKNQYQNSLRKPSCIIKCVEEVCGGWTQETFKQIVQKLTKKNQAPLPLFFDTSVSMDTMTNKKASLQQLFIHFDTRGIGRIDATELFSVMLLLSKGDLAVIITNQQDMVEIFGQDKSTYITSDEFFYFLDCLFRGLSKILIKQNEQRPTNVNKRQDIIFTPEDLKLFVSQIFKGQNSLLKDQLVENFGSAGQLAEFIIYVHQNLQSSMEYSRDEALKMMRLTLEVKKVMSYILVEVDKKLKTK